MSLQQKRQDLNNIVRETLNGRKDPEEMVMFFGHPNYLLSKSLDQSYGLGDFMTQDIHLGKILAVATVVYAKIFEDPEAVAYLPAAYMVGRTIDLSYKFTKLINPRGEKK